MSIFEFIYSIPTLCCTEPPVDLKFYRYIGQKIARFLKVGIALADIDLLQEFLNRQLLFDVKYEGKIFCLQLNYVKDEKIKKENS